MAYFPWSDGVGSERLLPLCLDFCIRLQMRNDPTYDDALFMCFEVSNVVLCAFGERDLVFHSCIVSEKPARLNGCGLGTVCITAQGFSRREREIPLEPADLLAREADGCKPLLGRFRSATVFSREMSLVIAGTKRCGTTMTV